MDVPIKEAVKIDGSTISIVKHDGTDGENDQRQVVLGVGPDAGGYVVLYDKTGKKPTYIYNSITPGATYLQDGNSYTADKANEYGRLEYGDYYNGTTQFIATLDDGQKYAGDNYQAAETETKNCRWLKPPRPSRQTSRTSSSRNSTSAWTSKAAQLVL